MWTLPTFPHSKPPAPHPNAKPNSKPAFLHESSQNLLLCGALNFLHPAWGRAPSDAPTRISAGDPPKQTKRNATATGVAVPTCYSIYFCSEHFPRKERIQSFLNCSTNFWGRIKILQTQSISSHRGGGNHWPDDVKSSCGNESSARSLKIEMNILGPHKCFWKIYSPPKKAIVSNQDQAPFYPSVFLRCLKNILTLRSSWNRCSW